MTVYRIELDEVKKHRNRSEWRTVPRARCAALGIEIIADGNGIGKVCDMIAEVAESDSSVTVWRGDMLVFHEARLEHWLQRGGDGLPRRERKPQPAHLARKSGR